MGSVSRVHEVFRNGDVFSRRNCMQKRKAEDEGNVYSPTKTPLYPLNPPTIASNSPISPPTCNPATCTAVPSPCPSPFTAPVPSPSCTAIPSAPCTTPPSAPCATSPSNADAYSTKILSPSHLNPSSASLSRTEKASVRVAKEARMWFRGFWLCSVIA